MARDLLKPRPPRRLAVWLAQEVAGALTAELCGIWLRGWDGHDAHSPWTLWYAVGEARHLPQPVAPGAGEALAQAHGGWLLPIPGLSGPVAMLWFRGGPSLDEESQHLLMALAGAAGMSLEQSLRVEGLGRDLFTKLLHFSSFLEQGGAELRVVPASGRAHMVMMVRLDTGPQAAPFPKKLAARQAVVSLPPGSPTFMRSRDASDGDAPCVEVFAVVAERMAQEGAQLAQAWGQALGQCTQRPWRAAWAATTHAVDDLNTLMDELSARARGLPPNSAGPA